MSYRVEASTDVIGVFGDIDDFKQVYGFALDGIVSGVEMVGISMRLPHRIRSFEDAGVKVGCIHGRPGGIREIRAAKAKGIIFAANTVIIPTQSLLEYNTNRDVLVHAPELRSETNKKAVMTHGNKEGIFWIENHSGGEAALNEVLNLVTDLRAAGVNAGVIFDPCHLIGGEDLKEGNIEVHWPIVLNMINNLTSQQDQDGSQIPFGLHLAVGTLKIDSLPVDEISDDMWREMAGLIRDTHINRIVFEYQREGLTNYLWPAKNDLGIARRRVEVIFNRLQKVGILP